MSPEGYTLYTYAAVQVWAAAAEKAGSFETGALANAIRSGSYLHRHRRPLVR